jgi:A/G-specific adenine glycosylase
MLREWQGLGYNRRAKMLHLCAQKIVTDHKGKFPKTHQELMKLPGVGHYTAGAIMAFVYNEPVPIIETNIRTVFIHHFFNDDTDITDAQLFPLIGIVLDRENPREWYYAVMDYGVYLKKTVGNQNVRSKHYAKQSPFKGSNRQIRGAILHTLSACEESRQSLHVKLSFDIDRIDAQIEQLSHEGMVVKRGHKYRLP